MQNLTEPPRDDLTEDVVRSLLAGGPQVQVDQGCDLLDTSNRVIGDLTGVMAKGGEVTGNNNASGTQVFAKCQLKFGQAQAWGAVRVRPWVVLSDGTTTARFNLGVYVLTTPDTPSGEDPVTYDVQGYDLTTILQDAVGDTRVCVADGTRTVLDALRQVVTDSGINADLLLSGDAQATVLPYTMVWCLYDGGPTWQAMCNDLLGLIGYENIWADENGALRSGPERDVATAPSETTLDATDTDAGIVAPGWKRSEDLWSAPNSWKFIRTNMDTEPTEGAGVYSVVNQSDGLSSIDSIGRTRHKTVWLDAADQASLEAQGDQIVAQDKSAGMTITLQTFLPTAGHGDVLTFIGDRGPEKLPVQSWTTNLDGSPGQWVLGGVERQPSQPLSASATATVTQASASGLRILVDGATQDSPANSLDGATYSVGQRVTCTIRNPVPPLVQGVETT